ncbi:hypothetical protein Patl1_12362 [Pistacia atlantica]|uniref:Uncharacterized protein n=1 Tax=Pistacia atlantica TaxID=434234 RepID=A0ACC1A4T1_9ROSI|nr:hypothetical protein Patl1_12362 [Pistacia atlantica]
MFASCSNHSRRHSSRRAREIDRPLTQVPQERRSEVKLRSDEFDDGGVDSDGGV